MKMSQAELQGLISKQFEMQRPLLGLFQTLADHFYPERADFTTTRNVGSEMADLLVDSNPVLMRRDLGNSLSAMLRDGEWFQTGVADRDPDYEGSLWLEWSAWKLRKLFNDRRSGFVRATKTADHDYVTFGQGVISVEPNRKRDGLLFRSWHLRDVAWWDDETGQVAGVCRRSKTTFREMVNYFPEENLPDEVRKDVLRTPFQEVELVHVVMPSEMYGDEELQSRFPYVSLYLDTTHEKIIEETGLHEQMYVVPRFQTIAGSPYAYSPATIIALPDARTLQAMTHTLLEASERYARPPLIATAKAIRSDVDLSADGITWVDADYDERAGAALRPLAQDRGGFPIGSAMREGIVEVLKEAFFLNTLSVPDLGREMTAFEVNERMKQFRRQNLPLFAPMESDYNGQVCELAFSVALRNGLLGSPQDIPESLQGADVEFSFVSPLSKTEEEERAQRFAQVAQALATAAQFDKDITLEVNFQEAFRDAVLGIGAPTEWLNDPKAVSEARQKKAEIEMAALAAQQAAQAQALQPPEANAPGTPVGVA